MDFGDGNLVDEEHIVESLETASDYEQGFERLKAMDHSIDEKLGVAAVDLPSIAGKK